MIFCVLCLATHSAAGDKITLKIASVTPPPGKALASDGVKYWIDKVTQRSGGRVTFQEFWGAAVAAPPAHLDLVSKKMVDVVLTHLWYTPGKCPLGNYEYIFPFGPSDPVIVVKTKRKLYEEFPAFKEEVKKYNGLKLAHIGSTPYFMLSKEPIKSLADMKGKKVSLVGRYFGRWISATGAIPVVAPMHDRYTMLQRGVVDIDWLPIDLFQTFKIYEVAKHLVKVDALLALPFDLVINLESFGALPPDIQAILIETGKDAEMYTAMRLIPNAMETLTTKMPAEGVKYTSLTEEQKRKWMENIPDIPAEWAAEVTEMGLPGWDIVRRYQEVSAELGYTWPRRWGRKKK